MASPIPQEIKNKLYGMLIETLNSGYALTRKDLQNGAVEVGLKPQSMDIGSLEARLGRHFSEQTGADLRVIKVRGTRVLVDPRMPLEDTTFSQVREEIIKRHQKKISSDRYA